MQLRSEAAQTHQVTNAPLTDPRADAALNELRRRSMLAYWRARMAVGWAVMPAMLAGMAAGGLTFLATHQIMGDDPAAMMAMAVYLLIGFGGGSFGIRRLGRRKAAELDRLTEHADVRAMRPLTDMVRGNVWAGSWFLMPVLRGIVAALSRLLDRVTPDDRRIIEGDDLAGLRAILTSCANHYGLIQSKLFPPEFIRKALRALTVLEDRHGHDLAQRLTRTIGVGRQCDAVRQIAREALPALREAAERARERAELLRPAESPGSPEDTLLRPAEAGPIGNVEMLVRPVEDDRRA